MTAQQQTSLDAWRSLDELPRKRAAVFEVLESFGPCTDAELAEHYAWLRTPQQRLTGWEWLPVQSPSGLRTRRCELVDAGLARDTGERRLTESGRLSIVWDAVRRAA